MYPIAQVQEPYSVVQYLAEHVPLEKILSLTPPDLDNALSFKWTAWAICEGKKKREDKKNQVNWMAE